MLGWPGRGAWKLGLGLGMSSSFLAEVKVGGTGQTQVPTGRTPLDPACPSSPKFSSAMFSSDRTNKTSFSLQGGSAGGITVLKDAMGDTGSDSTRAGEVVGSQSQMLRRI